MSKSKQFAAFVLAVTTATTLAESRCPGNVESLLYRGLNRHQIVVPVSINHSGPYNFMLDTGTQMTMIDPALAGELHLAGSGETSVRSAGVRTSASIAQTDLMEAGTHQVAGLKVVVFELGIPQAGSRDLRGILGEDFLEHFDLLIDNAHSLVCLDDSGKMRAEMKGRHVELLLPGAGIDGNGLARPPVVAVRLSDGMRPVLLELDSGADVSLLFDSSFMALGVLKGASLKANGASAELRTFRSIPPQNVKIGPVEVENAAFITTSGAQKDSHASAYDGLLSLGLFKRVLISPAERFAVLER
jgi:hypothetical protein